MEWISYFTFLFLFGIFSAASTSHKVKSDKRWNRHPRPLMIDCDAGVDDAQAIILAAMNPDLVDIVAFTTTAGNAMEENVYKNLLYVNRLMKRKIPIFRGAEVSKGKFLAKNPHPYYGQDGLGDMENRDDRKIITAKRPGEMDAPSALRHYARIHEGKLDLIMLGPLTNIAAVLRQDPNFGEKLRSCFIMGGNYMAVGNSGIVSEFNFDFDPESAKFVLENLRCPTMKIVPWETCLYQTEMARRDWLSMVEPSGTSLSRFVMKTEKSLPSRKEFADEAAMFTMLFPKEGILEELVAATTVETKGEFTRGMMVVDRLGRLTDFPKWSIVTELDDEMLRKEMIKALSKKPTNGSRRKGEHED